MPPRACPRAKVEFLVVVAFLILHTCSIDQNPVVDNTQLVLDRRFSSRAYISPSNFRANPPQQLPCQPSPATSVPTSPHFLKFYLARFLLY
jgi:hypothetical protein